MKTAKEIAEEMNKRGTEEMPKDCFADDGFDKWMHKELNKQNDTEREKWTII